jgi:hypothetical protein
MISSRAPLISAGQLYLNEELNEYLIVTKNEHGQISYSGFGFKGHSEDQSFVERFKPVNPTDVDSDEIKVLLSYCSPKVQASTGFIDRN